MCSDRLNMYMLLFPHWFLMLFVNKQVYLTRREHENRFVSAPVDIREFLLVEDVLNIAMGSTGNFIRRTDTIAFSADDSIPICLLEQTIPMLEFSNLLNNLQATCATLSAVSDLDRIRESFCSSMQTFIQVHTLCQGFCCDAIYVCYFCRNLYRILSL